MPGGREQAESGGGESGYGVEGRDGVLLGKTEVLQ